MPRLRRQELSSAQRISPTRLHCIPSMWILPLVGYAGVLLGFSFLTLAIGRPYFPPLSKPPPLRIATWPVQSYVPANSARTQASGLYYLSELVEEHTVLARKVLTRLIYTIMSIIVLLVLIDRFPFLLSGLSIASHAVYMGNLRHFPIVKLTDPVFILSCRKNPAILARHTAIQLRRHKTQS